MHRMSHKPQQWSNVDLPHSFLERRIDMKNYLIVGNGVAGTTAAKNIRKQDKEGKITIVTDEDFPFYWRIRLNEYLAGDLTEEALAAQKAQWYGDQRIDLKLKTLIAGADPLQSGS